jgi:hypothetical protein
MAISLKEFTSCCQLNDRFRYTRPMRRYPMVFILLLSFVMPLQAAADALLSGLVCPMMLENAQLQSASRVNDHSDMMDHSQMHKMTAGDEMPPMKCCPPSHQTKTSVSDPSAKKDLSAKTAKDCPQMKCCHLCKTSTQAFVYFTPNFIAPRSMTFVASANSPFILSFNPNAVWRPPITA